MDFAKGEILEMWLRLIAFALGLGLLNAGRQESGLIARHLGCD